MLVIHRSDHDVCSCGQSGQPRHAVHGAVVEEGRGVHCPGQAHRHQLGQRHQRCAAVAQQAGRFAYITAKHSSEVWGGGGCLWLKGRKLNVIVFSYKRQNMGG